MDNNRLGEIRAIQNRLSELTGLCGDHSCVFGPPKGMGRNGGCRCEVKRNPKVQMAIQLQRRLITLLLDARPAVAADARELVEQWRKDVWERDPRERNDELIQRITTYASQRGEQRWREAVEDVADCGGGIHCRTCENVNAILNQPADKSAGE